ncbi:hypothetical protein F4V89_23035 [Neorhizobium galegae]|nr:hypothetical protein F4V89_23035 [Neorhizobium galegae]
MKLVVHALPLRGEHANDSPPALTAYTWTVPAPRDRLDRKNVLFANFLAVSGMPTDEVSGSVEKDIQRRSELLCAQGGCKGGSVDSRYVDDILTPLFSTLRVRYFNQWSQPGPANSVTALRRKACEPSARFLEKDWSANTTPTGTLVYTYAVNATPVEYEVLGAGDWFLRGGRGTLTPDPKASDWYLTRGGVGYARGFTEIQIPVRVGPSPTSVYFPICTSVADAEKAIGQSVAGVRRSAAFMPRGVNGQALAHANPSDGYFTIWLDDRASAEGLSGPSDLKSELMLGTGDVLIMGNGRSSPSDVPTPSWQL